MVLEYGATVVHKFPLKLSLSSSQPYTNQKVCIIAKSFKKIFSNGCYAAVKVECFESRISIVDVNGGMSSGNARPLI